MIESCRICGCKLHRGGKYATPNMQGRSHATKHHFVAERFFGRSKTRKGRLRNPIFSESPWSLEEQKAVFCYECHEELIHNPVFLPEDIDNFAKLVTRRGFSESKKGNSRNKIAGRIILFHEIIERGIHSILNNNDGGSPLKNIGAG